MIISWPSSPPRAAHSAQHRPNSHLSSIPRPLGPCLLGRCPPAPLSLSRCRCLSLPPCPLSFSAVLFLLHLRLLLVPCLSFYLSRMQTGARHCLCPRFHCRFIPMPLLAVMQNGRRTVRADHRVHPRVEPVEGLAPETPNSTSQPGCSVRAGVQVC